MKNDFFWLPNGLERIKEETKIAWWKIGNFGNEDEERVVLGRNFVIFAYFFGVES